MLLDEDPATLINGCIANFHVAPDKSSLLRINSSLSTLSEARQLRLSSLHTDLKQLSRRLTTLNSHHAITTRDHNAAEHAQEILRLDTDKFRVAKEVTEMEVENLRQEEELRNLRGQLAELEERGLDGHGEYDDGAAAAEEDEVVLKLKVYRSLGIDVEPEEGSGEYKKAVIRNLAKGDVRVVNVDQKFSRYFYANYFWSSL
ncbi:hypothetical protein LTS18_004004 [Coniosporium uncinatum]|uniref:Uncharacterized protein n=1 Tax=Coniosporium uncinatum TaxID=93489 RepID=A0ACC3DSK6_9PEZI|nr:hypothetical protein LTS18_004004 [Coniosporium uncinatum]